MLFERYDWMLFRNMDTLAQKSGVSTRALARMVAKELADNALDIAGHCEYGKIGDRGFFIADAGEGIPGTDEEIARLFSLSRPLASSKLLRLPTRGALGNGLRVCAGAVLATDGTLTVATQGRTLRLTPCDDGTTTAEVIGAFEGEGTRIEVHLGKAAGMVNLQWVELAALMARGGAGYKGSTSPHWYDAESFFELTRAAGERSVRDLISTFDGCSGKRAGEIAAAFKSRPACSLTRDEAIDLLCAARQSAPLVKPERLGYVGLVDGLPEGYARVTGFHTMKSARNDIKAELPYVVEAWADFEHKESDADVFVCVNRTPVTGEISISHDKSKLALHGCGLNHYVGKIGTKVPRLWLNITTPFMPITGDGKAPDLLPFVGHISAVVEKTVGKAKRRNGTQCEKRVTEKDTILGYLEQAVQKASGEGQYRFSQRQLYYAVRDLSKKSDMSWDNFVGVLTEYEREYGDIEGMYRDPRGILYHPHTRQEIPLGTLAVERYERPSWTFNKVLYIEKEGFFAVLKDVGWPERNDCALLTSKGYASRAARDVIDLLGDSGEEVTFFCVHDADASGTQIYQSLQHATKARAARRVKIINLGLEPEEALEMGLQPEQFTRAKASPVAEYVELEWREWLQTQRVELNAMSTPEFLAWLDSKFADAVGKVIPPVEVMAEQLRGHIKEEVKDGITRQLMSEGRLDERVEHALEGLEPAIQTRLENLQEYIQEALEETPEHLWREAVEDLAEQVAEEIDYSQSGALTDLTITSDFNP